MSVITMIKTIKRVHVNDIALVKIGEFYHAYGKDACILAYLFDCKLKVIDNGCYTCGFSRKSIIQKYYAFLSFKISSSLKPVA